MSEVQDIEGVKESFLHIVLGDCHGKYDNALDVSGLETLKHRRTHLSTKFAVKASKHPKHKIWFELECGPNTMSEKPAYKAHVLR